MPAGQLARGARLGQLGNVDVMTTPFSIKGFTAEEIRNQGARNADEVFAADPSVRIALSPGFVLDQSSIRGFTVGAGAYRFDGLPGMISYSRVVAPLYERIELLKGPSSGVYGGGIGAFSVGGVVNLVPKRAQATPIRSITLGVNSSSLADVHVDLGQRFGVDQAFGVRANVVAENGEFSQGTSRESLTPVVALDFASDRVRLTVDAGTQSYRNTRPGLNRTVGVGQVVPTPPASGSDIQRPDFTRQQAETRFAAVGGEIDVTPWLTAYGKWGSYREEILDSLNLSVGPLQSNGNFLVNSVFYNTWTTDNRSYDVGLRSVFTTGPVKHQVSVSALGFRTFYKIPPTGQVTPAPVPIAPFTANLYADYSVINPFPGGFRSPFTYTGTEVIQSSIGIADNMTMFDDRLNLIVALRDQSIEQGAYKGRRVSPTVAASYQLGGGFTAYANYSEMLLQGAVAPGTAANAGQSLDPFVGVQHELGLKYNAGRWGSTLALFDIRQASAFTDPADNVFKAAGEQRNRGVELEGFGEIAKGVRVLGGVAWIDARQTRTLGGATDGKRALGVAQANVNLGAEADIAAVPGLTVGGRLIYTGEAFVNAANTQQLVAWTRVDLSARYATRISGQRVLLRAGVINAFDKAYWQSGGRNLFFLAQPRTFRLSASVDF
jgi:iron complex outermembrane receptor protein